MELFSAGYPPPACFLSVDRFLGEVSGINAFAANINCGEINGIVKRKEFIVKIKEKESRSMITPAIT
ncbi:hypothetical protein QFZ51_000803 [Chitinophaga sp. W3I9]|uniref:hypothetical protein n=1 Tax=unclassified Chitinophaga TaxID=2619133 RepID=UPI003D213632